MTQAQDRFVAVWGQMGGAWGISRTMAEVHALLYITDEPMCTDDIMDRLQISRGNASMSLRALVDWGLVVRSHKRGDRKEYFQAEQDMWAMARAIVRERLKREIEPLLANLYEIRDITREEPREKRGTKRTHAGDEAAVTAHHERLDSLIEFLVRIEQVSEKFVGPAGRGLQLAASLLNAWPDPSSRLRRRHADDGPPHRSDTIDPAQDADDPRGTRERA
jgi:HTH-type transcriptional regulator, glycine betaine synthesis regulator